ncbi:hypothetical protein GCM10023084_24520 [Streptomyces lacrimifluminis]|uniref:Uncharacterized protein n=1 Tax=Streptomyces lacrimifluminis TaxID=1500077 RepID=A0A917KJB2_9ACTN|nr:hypothetical protein GCM10012282_08730 [Streptomyces lacrimifluminis]
MPFTHIRRPERSALSRSAGNPGANVGAGCCGSEQNRAFMGNRLRVTGARAPESGATQVGLYQS